MGPLVTLFIVALAVVVLLATSSEARILLDYNSCYNGWQSWRNNGCRDNYWCNNYRWDCDGRYWDGNRWWGPGDSGGFCVGICFG